MLSGKVMMSDVLSKIRHLIALAASGSAEAAEARTAAHIAVRLIQGHRIELRDPLENRSGASTTRVIRARYAGRCIRCGRVYPVGSFVVWTKGRGAVHTNCTEA